MVAARRLLRRRHRDAAGLFLAEGPQAVREAIRAGLVEQLFATTDGCARHGELIQAAQAAEVDLWPVTEPALSSLSETVTPQGVVAVCRQFHHVQVTPVLVANAALVVALAGVADPGNAGTVVRTADAAGADMVIFCDGCVDAYNGKCVRSSAGSLFHLDLVRGGAPAQVVGALRAGGLRALAADAHAATDLDALADGGGLTRRTVWLFGSEAHGLPATLRDLADLTVRVPMRGQAESLNLAAAAAVCLYASARAQSRPDERAGDPR